ncbi:prohibitin family protein [Oleiphilus messinensis]|nr:prohibitin family protein [Oleiphilus messinensis]
MQDTPQENQDKHSPEHEPVPDPSPADGSEKGEKQNWDDRVAERVTPVWRRIKVPLLVCILVILFFVAYLFDRIFINIYPGEAGVLWKRFDDGVEQRVYGGGLHIINPFNIMHKYEVRVQQLETRFTVLSKNGLIIRIRASVRFMPNRKTLYHLHEFVGPDYIERVVIPETQAVIRRVLGEYEPEDIYATQGNIIQNIVLMALSELQQRHIILDDLLIKEILLPDNVAESIEIKLQEEQKFLAYQYILEREKKEIERKQLESAGIKIFQQTINQGLTPEYLKYQGIRATLELAKSNNSKLVVIGNGGDGLPLILNTPSDALSAPVNPQMNGLQMNLPNNPSIPMSTDSIQSSAIANTAASNVNQDKNPIPPESPEPIPEEITRHKHTDAAKQLKEDELNGSLANQEQLQRKFKITF